MFSFRCKSPPTNHPQDRITNRDGRTESDWPVRGGLAFFLLFGFVTLISRLLVKTFHLKLHLFSNLQVVLSMAASCCDHHVISSPHPPHTHTHVLTNCSAYMTMITRIYRMVRILTKNFNKKSINKYTLY